MITKAWLLSAANAALYLAFCALAGTGLLLEVRLDDEDGPARVLGMGLDDWSEIHITAAIVFAALSFLHLALNWSWIKAACRKSLPAKLVLAAGAVLVAALLLWPRHASYNDELSSRAALDKVNFFYGDAEQF
jgi:phosphoglycerol transferase MdoB-like AlkP superfamily enzyme